MSWLISFAWASSSSKDQKRGLQNEKFLLSTAGLEFTTLGLGSYRLNRLAIQTWHTVDVLEFNQVFPVLFKSSSKHMAEFLSCIQYFTHKSFV